MAQLSGGCAATPNCGAPPPFPASGPGREWDMHPRLMRAAPCLTLPKCSSAFKSSWPRRLKTTNLSPLRVVPGPAEPRRMLLDATGPLLAQTRLSSLTSPIGPWPGISGNDATVPLATTTPAHPLQNVANQARVMTSCENSSATSPTLPPRTPMTTSHSSNARLLTLSDALLSFEGQNLLHALAQTTSPAPWISMPGGVTRMLCGQPKKATPFSWSPTPRRSPNTPTRNPWSN